VNFLKLLAWLERTYTIFDYQLLTGRSESRTIQ